jgi:hypothetical protein
MEVLASEFREVLENLTPEQRHALNVKLFYLFYLKYKEEPLLECSDLIQSAFLDALDDRRHWDPERVSFVDFIWGAMRSNASHILAKKKKGLLQPIEEVSELVLLRREDSRSYVQLCAELRDLAGDDQVVSRLIELLIQDPNMKPRHMLDQMKDVPEKEVSNAVRRLRKLVRTSRKERVNG